MDITPALPIDWADPKNGRTWRDVVASHSIQAVQYKDGTYRVEHHRLDLVQRGTHVVALVDVEPADGEAVPAAVALHIGARELLDRLRQDLW